MSVRYHLAIRRLEDDAILVLTGGAMPGFQLDDPPPWPVVTPIVERSREDHGLEVIAWRSAWVSDPGDAATDRGVGDRGDRLYEAVHIGGRLPSGARWVPLDDLERRPTPMGRAIDAGVLGHPQGHQQPWYGPGWFDGMVTWIDERLAIAGMRRRGDVRQIRSWARSALVTVETDRGRLWAKQVPVPFAHEVAVTGLLSDLDPGVVPPLVAADPVAGRLLIEDVGGPLLSAIPDAREPWLATMSRFAEIQQVLSRDLSALRIAGVPRASLRDLALRVPDLLADDARLMVGQAGGLSGAESAALRSASSQLAAACEALDASAVGSSLDHGDLSAGQVIIGEMGPVFLDWSDATVTHPFLAAASFLDDPAGVPADLLPDLETAYLVGWAASVSHAAAARALELARVVHPLHMAQLHADKILPGLDQPWELAWSVPALLRSLVPRLATLPRILER
jgi:hypothetical protein